MTINDTVYCYNLKLNIFKCKDKDKQTKKPLLNRYVPKHVFWGCIVWGVRDCHFDSSQSTTNENPKQPHFSAGDICNVPYTIQTRQYGRRIQSSS